MLILKPSTQPLIEKWPFFLNFFFSSNKRTASFLLPHFSKRSYFCYCQTLTETTLPFLSSLPLSPSHFSGHPRLHFLQKTLMEWNKVVVVAFAVYFIFSSFEMKPLNFILIYWTPCQQHQTKRLPTKKKENPKQQHQRKNQKKINRNQAFSV